MKIMNEKDLEKKSTIIDAMYKKIINISEQIKDIYEVKGNNEKVETLGNQLAENIIKFIKATRQPFVYEDIEEYFEQIDFWEDLKEYTKGVTSRYVEATCVSVLESEFRTELYFQVSELIYIELEDIKYAVEKLSISKEIISLIYKIISVSEDIILLNYMSKRRYIEIMDDMFGLENQDLEFIWNLFKENHEKWHKVAISRCINRQESKLNRLSSKVEYLGENLDALVNILADES